MNRRAASVSVVLGVLVALLLALSGCGGSDSATKGKSTREVLTLAKQKFDRTRSVHLVLSTDDTPTKGDAVLGADGTLTHQPAFEGKVTVVLGGFNADVPVVSIDGKVFAKLPLTPKYVTIDPGEYGAPDPAELTHWMAERMPYFMVPRYIRFVDTLPKTPTERVQKVKLRDEGITADTFDREAAGITIKR